jgi:Kef-type K+ transport system membrane component KefB
MNFLLGELHDVHNWLLIGLIILVGHGAGKLAGRCRMPSVVGYLIVGVILGNAAAGGNLLGLWSAGPESNIVNPHSTQALELVTDFGLGIVAFVIGSELSVKLLRRTGKLLAAILFGQFFATVLLVIAGVWLLSDWVLPAGVPALPAALLFGAVAAATAPAGTVAVIQEYKAKGPVTRMLLTVVGLDDGLAIMVYAFAAAIARAMVSGKDLDPGAAIALPAFEIIGSLIVGAIGGAILTFFVRRTRNRAEVLTLSLGMVLLITGICNIEFSALFAPAAEAGHALSGPGPASSAGGGTGHPMHLSLILANLGVGMAVVNLSPREGERTATSLAQITHPVYVLFFVIAGAHLNLMLIATAGLLMPVYIVFRTTGKMGGAWFGARVAGGDVNMRRYLGLGLLPQAGVAIGLAMLIATEFARLGPAASKLGKLVINTIAATTIFFEVIGPIGAKIALQKSGEINAKKSQAGEES